MADMIPGGGGGGGRNESVVERINVVFSRLVEIGFNQAEQFTVKMIHECGFTETEFLGDIKSFSSITNPDDLRSIFDAARKSVQLSFPNEFSKFIGYVTWLKGTEGSKLVYDVASKKKPEVKNGNFSQAQVEFAHMLLDYAAPHREKFVRIKKKVEELKMRQTDLEAKWKRIVDDWQKKLGPLWEYQELPIRRLRVKAYTLYKADRRYNSVHQFYATLEPSFGDLENDFCDAVRRNDLLEFMNDLVRKKVMEDFFKQRIVRLKLKEVGGDYEVGEREPSNAAETKFKLDVLDEILEDPDSKRVRIGLLEEEEGLLDEFLEEPDSDSQMMRVEEEEYGGD